MKTDDNKDPCAFPFVLPEIPGHSEGFASPGMALRDYFAGQVIGHIYSALVLSGYDKVEGWPEGIACDAGRIADAMMAERERRQG